MEDANTDPTKDTVDLAQFMLWYNQSGTPQLRVKGEYDPMMRTYTLDIEQNCPPTPGMQDFY